jgi:hypothetical protein
VALPGEPALPTAVVGAVLEGDTLAHAPYRPARSPTVRACACAWAGQRPEAARALPLVRRGSRWYALPNHDVAHWRLELTFRVRAPWAARDCGDGLQHWAESERRAAERRHEADKRARRSYTVRASGSPACSVWRALGDRHPRSKESPGYPKIPVRTHGCGTRVS